MRLAERSNPREIFIPTMAMIIRGRRLLTKNPIRIIGEDANHFGYKLGDVVSELTYHLTNEAG